MSMDLKTFKNPGSIWRSAPFWSWNYLLTPEKIRAEAATLIKSGMGGYFCHSRWGLETPYMSQEWMNAIKAAVAEAKKRNAYCWLYDEDRWPSGAAGGLVTIPHPEYRAQRLIAEWPPQRVFAPGPVTGMPGDQAKVPIARYAVVERRHRKQHFRPLAANEWPKRGELLLVLSRLISPNNAWYNGGAYLDTMNPDAVRAFIEHTYEGYRKEVGREFGKSIPGIFTDEPNYFNGRHDPFNLAPWTARLPEEFRERCGYELLPELPHVFYNVVDAIPRGMKVRRDFYRVCCELFEEAFSRQIGNWCTKHRIAYTGHYLAEESLESQTKVIGAAMPHYVHQHIPGIDILGRRITEVLTCKQVSSMAEQFSKPRVLSELYGGAGWQFRLADQKWTGDWQYALGVNLRCQHLVLTTLRGGAKRDYPPSFFPHAPWWKHNNVIEDYFGRLSYTLSRGKAIRDLLVIHPVESAWAMRTSKRDEPSFKALTEYDKRFAAFLLDLLGIHRDFDLGDESVMARFGRVSGGKLAIGRARYTAVLVPELLTLRRTTLRLLEKFAKAGGKIVFLKPGPIMLEGSVSPEPARILRGIASPCGASRPAIDAALAAALPPRVSIREDGKHCAPVIYMLRQIDGRQILFLANTDDKNGHNVIVELSQAPTGVVEEMDTRTGELRRIEGAIHAGGVWQLAVNLPAIGSALFAIGKPSGRARPAIRTVEPVSRIEIGANGWSFRRDEPNALTLDLCRWRVRREPFSKLMHIRGVDAAVRRALDYPAVGNGGTMRWKQYLPEDLARERSDGPPVELQYEFAVRDVPRKRFALAIERPGRFKIALNGKPVSARPDATFADECIETVPLPAPRRGVNKLTIVTGFRPEHELEDVYLVGDFGVNAKREIVSEPKMLKRNTYGWTKQGYFHFGGSIMYSAEVNLSAIGDGERLVFKVDDPAVTSMELAVNGKLAGVIPWPPYELDITRFLKRGKNRIELTAVGSRRNMMGPLHRKQPDPWMIGGENFSAPAGREKIYSVIPQGLTGRAWLVRGRTIS